jgi:glycosyltransferase involved in cell wall biosynthesis
MTSISVVLPVRDGEPYLEEVLQSLAAADVVEVLVIDSGSRDRSREIVRAAGVELLEIAPEEFGHGRTRNLGAERTTGDLICFLTQDATPAPGWVDAYREAFALDERVGAAYGPHLPREDTSPMIARELTEFFRGFSPEGVPVVQRKGDSVFLSNVNACYARACWEEIRFPDVPYSEDQAFGRELLERGWSKVYHPGAAVLHAHAYGWVEFMRRYFDEYRGLRETIGHEEPFDLLGAVRGVRVEVANDRRWMEARGMSARERARWTGRAIAHHSGRRVFSALGSRAEVLPPRARAKISLEGRADGVGPEASPSPVVDARPPARARGASWWHDNYETIVKVLHDGPAPLLDAVPGMSDRPGLHVAVVIPPFARASGGHSSIFQLVSRLEALGHTCSVWLYDPLGHQPQRGAAIRHNINEFFTPVRAPAFRGFDRWYGADVAVATGWQTVYPVLALDGCRARAYLVHDHEPEFYAASAESHWAERSYEFGLYCIAASPWLLDIVTTRYGGRGTTFQFGVDHDAYRIRPLPRRRDTVVFYGRMVTPRRAVPLGILALGELHRRRPDVRIVLFGDEHPPYTPFPYEHVGIATPEQLSWVYSEATVGLCLSMTNYSLVPQEMMACGLPCVDLAGFSAESVFGVNGPAELAAFDPWAIADAIERLLDDEDRWAARSRAGLDFVAAHDWRAAAGEVDFGLREALREREPAA